MALSDGKRFEQEFTSSIDECLYRYRIPDPPQSFNQQVTLRFSNKNPFDLFVFKKPNLFCLELKTTKTKSFSFPTVQEKEEIEKLKLCGNKKETKELEKKLKSRNIKLHQIDELKKAHNKGCLSYFIFNFREIDGNPTYAMHIDDFINFWTTTDKKSINITDIQEYCKMFDRYFYNNTQEIKNEKASKRANTKRIKYDLDVFLEGE